MPEEFFEMRIDCTVGFVKLNSVARELIIGFYHLARIDEAR